MLTGLDFSRGLAHPYAWPGGYPMFLVMADGGCLCFDCAKTEKTLIRHAAMTKSHNGWRPASFYVNWESEIFCDNCNAQIESAYPCVCSQCDEPKKSCSCE